MSLEMPKFANESEEADWWYEHRDELAEEMARARREGRLGEGSRARWERRQAEAAKLAENALVSTAK